jgi:hypothetical protein
MYNRDRILNPLLPTKPWERPPLRKVICAFGTGLRTDLGYRYKFQPGLTYNTSEWTVLDSIVEEGDQIYSLSGHKVSLKGMAANAGRDTPLPPRKSGDGTVPYHSLSWCHHWLGPVINVTRVPQRPLFLDGEVVHYTNVDAAEFHRSGRVPLTPSELTRTPPAGNASPTSPSVRPEGSFNTFYSDYSISTGDIGLRETHVWELDLVVHRGLIQHPVFIRELRSELMDDLAHDLAARRLRRRKGSFQARPPTTRTVQTNHHVAADSSHTGNTGTVNSNCHHHSNDGQWTGNGHDRVSHNHGSGVESAESPSHNLHPHHNYNKGANQPLTTNTQISNEWDNDGIDDGTDLEVVIRRMEAEARMNAAVARRNSGRPPQSDDDCSWDYARVECRYPTHCIYDYRFGDYHLTQSCRLRPQPLLDIAISPSASSSSPPASTTSTSEATASSAVDEDDDAATSPSGEPCECIDQGCVHGFCRYHDRCVHATQAFGPSNGWWGPCMFGGSPTNT